MGKKANAEKTMEASGGPECDGKQISRREPVRDGSGYDAERARYDAYMRQYPPPPQYLAYGQDPYHTQTHFDAYYRQTCAVCPPPPAAPGFAPLLAVYPPPPPGYCCYSQVAAGYPQAGYLPAGG